MQFDADTVGAASVAADAEICMMAADTLERVGIQRGDYVIKVNNRKVLDGVMEAIGLEGEGSAGRRLAVLRALDKYDRLGEEGVRLLLGPGRKDESGDFTRGAGLDDEQIHRLTYMFGLRGDADALVNFQIHHGEELPAEESGRAIQLDAAVFHRISTVVSGSNAGEVGCDELREITDLVRASGYGPDRVVVDPSVVRGLEYYTGPVYEAELTFPVTNEDGQQVRFGSVAGGGRYDGLVGRFRSEPVPATGFSIGVSRLLAALKAVNSPIVTGETALPLAVVTVMDRERIADYQKMVAELRGLRGADGKPLMRAEMYLGDGRFGAQMKYADRRGAFCAVIQGSDEHAKGEVQIKDLVLGAELAAGGKNRSDHLEKQQQAQFAVGRDGLTDAVRKVLARHAPAQA
jgi:histidyl-tRNA synthetase